MHFQRRFEHPKRKNDPVIVTWEGAYENVAVHYRGEVIGAVESAEKLLEGVSFIYDQLGVLKLLLYAEPFDLHVFFDEIHSPSNTNHPSVNIPSTAMNFIFPLILNFIIFVNIYESWDLANGFDAEEILTMISAIGLTVYGASVILLVSNMIFGYILGALMLVIQCGLFVFSLGIYEWGELIGGSGIMMLLNLIPLVISARAILNYRKHQKAITEPEALDEIIDEPFS